MENKHLVWMLTGCTVPLLLIFPAPAFGLGGNTSLLIFIAAMFAFHLLMPHGHGEQEDHSPNRKDERYEHH